MHRTDFSVELIYVDSGSKDNSIQLAAAAGATVITLDSTRPTAAQGRNAGWRNAAGATILFLDGDTVLDPRFVAESLPVFEDQRVAIVWGHRRETLETRTLYNRVLDLDWIYAPGDTAFCGGDALFRRLPLEQTGGFKETLIAGEEPELCQRITALGLRIVHVDRSMTGHDLGITRFSQYWRRATRGGYAFAEVSSRYAHTDNPFWLAESNANRLRGAILIAFPLAAMILALALYSLWPIVTGMLLFLVLAVRTSWKARWKSKDKIALALYGIHSHLQQIPILVGQMRFWRDRRKGRAAQLVEYKQP
jgi:cellulose synthase/poly-beta-1,6-N-acetylglucosamine synthase-like glycosyltransferase